MALRTALVAGAVVVLDQLTKLWVVSALPFGAERDVVPGLLRLVHTRNRGIAFGLLGDAGPLVQALLLLVVVATVGFLVHQLRRTGAGAVAAGVGLAMVLGGALGNLADRLWRGEVVDFVDAFVRLAGREHHWPAFNVADAAITLGVAVVIVAELRKGREGVPGTR